MSTYIVDSTYLLDLLVDGSLFGSHEACTHVHTSSTHTQRCCELLTVCTATRHDEGNLMSNIYKCMYMSKHSDMHISIPVIIHHYIIHVCCIHTIYLRWVSSQRRATTPSCRRGSHRDVHHTRNHPWRWSQRPDAVQSTHALQPHTCGWRWCCVPWAYGWAVNSEIWKWSNETSTYTSHTITQITTHIHEDTNNDMYSNNTNLFRISTCCFDDLDTLLDDHLHVRGIVRRNKSRKQGHIDTEWLLGEGSAFLNLWSKERIKMRWWSFERRTEKVRVDIPQL